jgi:uncharacterized protein (TIGR02453 family)
MTSQRFAAFSEEGLRFLRLLKRNNNREWFLANKSIYEETVKKPMEDLVSALADDFASFAPEHVASPKTSIYRIYRDTRFSKDKTPYKTHIAAIFPRKGFEKHEGAGLYLHIAADEVLIAGGVYMPMPEHLNAIRAHIADNHRKFRSIVEARAFHKMFDRLTGEQLTRVPRGFPPDHTAANYLRHKQFLAGRTLEPVAATSQRFYKTVVETFQEMMPLIRFLNEPIVRNRKRRDRESAVLRG